MGRENMPNMPLSRTVVTQFTDAQTIKGLEFSYNKAN